MICNFEWLSNSQKSDLSEPNHSKSYCMISDKQDVKRVISPSCQINNVRQFGTLCCVSAIVYKLETGFRPSNKQGIESQN